MTDPEGAIPAGETVPIGNAEDARTFLDRLDRTARHWRTPCGEGAMAWRSWGAGPPVLLLHGGAGSWRHWSRNLAAVAHSHTAVAPDLPGLGDSAPAPDPIDAEAVAAIVLRGFDIAFGQGSSFDLAGFSFGAVVAGLVAAAAGDRVRSLTLIGAGGLGPPNRSLELVRLRGKTGAERIAGHRENLRRAMLADPSKIDALALEIQEENTARARLNSGAMWQSSVLQEALPRVRGRVHAIWGDGEMPNRALLEARISLMRQARPDVEVTVVPQAGHWVFYEAAGLCNALLDRILAG